MVFAQLVGQRQIRVKISEVPNRLVVFAQLVGQRQIHVNTLELPNRLEVFARPVGETQNFCGFLSKHETSTQ